MNKFTAFLDGDRYIIGRASDQTGYSMTMGFASAYSKREAADLIRKFNADPPKQEPRVYWTDQRFEIACDDGKFGAAWE